MKQYSYTNKLYTELIISAMLYNYSYYYFDKNTLGDVTAIRDNSGNIIATYEYDAWGNHTVLNANGSIDYSANSIGNINPFRYRGYYYDTETGFYYLQTRYYDPTICRFINADNYELVGALSLAPGGLNMYAYCNNNPIMYTDESGEIFFTLLIGLGISFAVGMGVSIVSQGLQYGWNDINYLQAGVDGAFSALSIGLAATGIGLGASMALGAAMGAAQYAIDSAVFRNDFTWQGALIATGIGGVAGAFSGAGAQNAKGLADAILKNTSATATGMISGIRSLTGNTAFSNVVNQSFATAARKINIITVINSAVTTIKEFISGD